MYHDQSGSAIIEFAVASTILCSLVFGVMAMCLAFDSDNITSEAAREATRYAIVRGSACSSSTFSNCNITSAQLQTYVRSIGFPGINPSSSTLTAVASWPDGNNNPGSQVQVTAGILPSGDSLCAPQDAFYVQHIPDGNLAVAPRVADSAALPAAW